MNTTKNLTTGYRGSKAHAVDTTTYRNRSMMEQANEAVALCGWAVTVGEVEFKDSGSITCRTCAKAAK